MAGPPDDRAPPEFVDIPDVAALENALESMTPPYTIRFSQGASVVSEKFEGVDTSRGAGIAELHFDGERYVTVNVSTQLNGVSE